MQKYITNTGGDGNRETKDGSYIISGLSNLLSRYVKIPEGQIDFWGKESNKQHLVY